MKQLIICVFLLLPGCASYDWGFNRAHERAQLAVDNIRHIRGSLEQGQLP